MRFKVKYLILLISIFNSVVLFGQEEFFKDQGGLTLSGLKSFHSQAMEAGFGAYFKKGFFIGLSGSLIKENDNFFSAATFGYLTDMDTVKISLKMYFGLSFGVINSYKFGAFNFGLIKCFFLDSNFPFSLNSALSVQKVMSFELNEMSGIFSSISIGYTQAFFAKKEIYPVLGISKVFGLNNTDIKDLYLNIGLNVRFGKNVEN
jgi:hypothetical protein